MTDQLVRNLSLPEAAAGKGLVPSFQPIVDLTSGEPVGYEALARWPDAGGMSTQAIFAAAQAQGRLDELDVACRVSALQGALDAGLGDGAWLFVNAEPGALGAAHLHSETLEVVARAHRELRLVLELTERALLDHPSDLLRYVTLARAAGWRIALDDLGVNPDSAALLDLLMPDVIKLDLSLVQHDPSRDQMRTLAAVIAHSERYGVTVLAEGIETTEHLEQARACGATLGQGLYFGAPASLPDREPSGARLGLPVVEIAVPRTPFDVARDHPRVRTAKRSMLIALSRHVEEQADNAIDPPVVLTALQDERQLRGETLTRYMRLSEVCPLVAVLGRDVPSLPGESIRGAALDADDPLGREWTVVALGAQTAVALIARDRCDDADDLDRRFDFLVTYDRQIVTQAARSLMTRVR